MAAVFGAVGIIAGPLIGWAVARRSKSGRVETTEAESLWAEGRDFRATVIAEATRLRDRVIVLEADAVNSFNDSLTMRRDLDSARRDVEDARSDAHRLRSQVALCETRVADCDERIAYLEGVLTTAGVVFDDQ